MTPEKLQDAISLLPFDLLEETDKLRSRAVKKPKNRWLPMAACFALVLVCAFAFFRLMPGTGGSDRAPEAPAMLMSESAMEEAPAAEAPAEKAPARNEPALEAPREEFASDTAASAGPLLTLRWLDSCITAAPDPVTGSGDRPLPEPHAVNAELVTLHWDHMPQEILVLCPPDTIPERLEDNVLMLDPQRTVYDITARWADGTEGHYLVHLVMESES